MNSGQPELERLGQRRWRKTITAGDRDNEGKAPRNGRIVARDVHASKQNDSPVLIVIAKHGDRRVLRKRT